MGKRSLIVGLLGAILLLGPVACGGGGGEEDTACVPGLLRTLALQGDPAPEVVGNFGLFDAEPLMDVAAGGWSVFVAPTSDPTAVEVLYVALPGGTLLLVYAVGDTVPDAGGGTISGFQTVHVNASGHIVTTVDITGDAGSRTIGLLSARVDTTTNTVVERNDLVYDGDALVGLTGTVNALLDPLTTLTSDNHVFFGAITTTPQDGLFRVGTNGVGLQKLVGTGTTLFGGTDFETLEALGVDPVGSRYAFVAVQDTVPETRAIYIGVVGVASFAKIVEEDDPMGGGTVDGLPTFQPVTVDASGRVLFKAIVDGTLDHLCVGSAVAAPEVIAFEGQADVWSEGVFGNLDWLNMEPGTQGPVLQADVSLSSRGITFALYDVPNLLGDPRIVAYNGRAAPTDLGDPSLHLWVAFPGLADPGHKDVDAGGSIAFSNVLDSGRPGLFWFVYACDFVTIAAGGQVLPDGVNMFDGDDSWRATTASNVVLFRAPVVTLGSGIFRRGP